MTKLKWFFSAIVIMLLFFPTGVYAHTGLKTSSPEDGQAVKEEVKEISLVFHTAIEPVSKFEIKDEQGNPYEVSDIQVDESRMTGAVEPPLKNGSYTVEWKIIGQDGHAVKGSLTFRVDAPAEQPSPTAPESSAAAPSPSPSQSSAPAPAVSPQPDKGASDNSSLEASSYASWIIFALVAAVLIIMAVSILRNKRK